MKSRQSDKDSIEPTGDWGAVKEDKAKAEWLN